MEYVPWLDWLPRKGQIQKERWELLEQIHIGDLGARFFSARDLRNGNVVIYKCRRGLRSLDMSTWETFVLQELNRLNVSRVPTLLGWGPETNVSSVFFCVPQMGTRLDRILNKLYKVGLQLSLSSVLFIARESLSALAEIHEAGFLYRAIKPENIFIDGDRLTLANFELTNEWRLPDGGHRSITDFAGTFRYGSANALCQYEQGRCDDLFSWFFQLIDLTVGDLPWSTSTMIGVNVYERMRNLALMKTKILDESDSLTKKCPPEYSEILRHVRSLNCEDKPDYDLLQTLLKQSLPVDEESQDILDWNPGGRCYQDLQSLMPF